MGEVTQASSVISHWIAVSANFKIIIPHSSTPAFKSVAI
jgi:hypothetical protein